MKMHAACDRPPPAPTKSVRFARDHEVRIFYPNDPIKRDASEARGQHYRPARRPRTPTMTTITPTMPQLNHTAERTAPGTARPASRPIAIPARPSAVTDAHLRADIAARTMESRIKSNRTASIRPVPRRANPPPLPLPASKLARFLLAAGACVIGLGIPLGMLSMVALGPVGLAVAGAAAALGAALIWLGSKAQ